MRHAACDVDPAPQVDCPDCGRSMRLRHLWCAHCIADKTMGGKRIGDDATHDAIVARHYRILAVTMEALLCS